MDTKELTQRVIGLEKVTSEHQQKISALFDRQSEIQDLTKATYELVGEVKALTENVNSVDKRLACIENGERQKHFELWKAVVPAIVSAVIAFLVASILN